MRIRSTDSIARVDDTGNEVIDASSALLDCHAPGRIEVFPRGSTYDLDGLDRATGEVAASWAGGSGWPTHPVAILGESTVRLSEGTNDDTQGLRLYHVLSCEDDPPSGDWLPSQHQVRVLPGAVWVLREGGLWLFDFSEDRTFIWSIDPPPFIGS